MLPIKEDLHTEFKTSFNEDVIVSLVAFANAKGGKAYVGVNDKGEVVGVELEPESVQKWINEIKQKTEPSIIPDIDVAEMDGKQVVVLTVQEYPVKPVSVKGRYYKRQANSNHQLSAGEIADMHLQTRNSSWDYYFSQDRQLDDIDMHKVAKAMRIIAKRNPRFNIDDPLEFLRKYELVDASNRITNGCYLMFCRGESVFTTVQMGLFASETLIKDDDMSNSDIIGQVEEVMQFLRKHINKGIIITDRQTQNIQRWEYPLDALREIVLNMIVHRNYRSTSESVIKVFQDHILFYNPGKLPDNITVEQLMQNEYVSTPYNKQIAAIFKEMGEIERYGTGIKRVREMFADYGLPAPEWKLMPGGVGVCVYSATFISKDAKKEPKSENAVENAVEKLTGNQRQILSLMRDNPSVSKAELSVALGIHISNIDRNIQKLRNNGYINRIGPAKGGHWQVLKG